MEVETTEKPQKPKEQKSFLRKHEVPIIIALTIVFIYAIVFLNQKINFYLGNELIVYLSPNQKSISMHYSNQSFVTFDISIENSANCKALCQFQLYDRSRDELIDHGEFGISKGQHEFRSYTISAKRKGSGQDIYSFDVKCKSVASLICLTASEEKERTSLVTVNYDLSLKEKQLKESLKGKVEGLLTRVKESDELLQKLNQRYFELGKAINLNDIADEKAGIDDGLNGIIIEIENIRSIWSLENYREIDELPITSFEENLTKIKESIDGLNIKIDNTLSEHNKILEKLSALTSRINLAIKFSNLLLKNEQNNISLIVLEFNRVSNSATNNTLGNYTIIFDEISRLEQRTDEALLSMREDILKAHNKINYLIFYENRLACEMGECGNETLVWNMDIFDEAEKFFEDYPGEGLRCSNIDLTDNRLAAIRKDSAERIFSQGMVLPPSTEFGNQAEKYYLDKKRQLNNSLMADYNLYGFSGTIRNSFEGILPPNVTNINESLNETLDLYLLSKINFSDEILYAELKAKCRLYLNPVHRIQDFDFSPVLDFENYTVAERINTTLPENPPQCCIFSECRPCCMGQGCRLENYPVIFLHGHSFYSGNSPEYSLDAFNKIQSRMQKDGYISAGIVSLYSKNEESEDGVWGLSGRPVTVKASYYYDAISQDDKYVIVPTKSESIDTYALRLSEIIEIVKKRTGKDKVNIVAHSMGGLVARKYMQIFGDEDVEKLVMIATPNKGISQKALSLCSYAGEALECRDMAKGSIFIGKLDDPQKQPKNAKLFNIIGTGCTMKTGEGDGVVLVEDVQMSNANNFYIEGKCTGVLGQQLHTELLNIDKYHSTYDTIKYAIQS